MLRPILADSVYALTQSSRTQLDPPEISRYYNTGIGDTFFNITSSIGIPAVPDGSPSSEYLLCPDDSPITYALTLCEAS